MKCTTALSFLSLVLCSASAAYADTFGSGLNTFDIEFVEIGNAGNAADTSGNPNPAGSVADLYRIGKFEISEDKINKANEATTGDPSPLSITHDGRGANKPATSISWLEAATFINWLNTSTNHSPAYKFDDSGNFQLWQPADAGYDPNNLFRNRQAIYFLPSVDEWYKAAFYDPTGVGAYHSYATGSDTAPTAVAGGMAANTAVFGQSLESGPADVTQAGGLSPYGTMGQGGNAFEWEETEYDLVNDSTLSDRGLRGGHWNSISTILLSTSRSLNGFPTNAGRSFGFRVASTSGSSGVLGDYNNDGIVNAADYVSWRDHLGAPAGTLPNDTAGGAIGAAQYGTWKANFGAPNGSGSATGNLVPEPSTVVLLLMAVAGWHLRRGGIA